jgi:hypothetical protein
LIEALSDDAKLEFEIETAKLSNGFLNAWDDELKRACRVQGNAELGFVEIAGWERFKASAAPRKVPCLDISLKTVSWSSVII